MKECLKIYRRGRHTFIKNDSIFVTLLFYLFPYAKQLFQVMGYLSDVEVGGHTVFPLIGAYIKPRKGSIVVWWNMDQGGGHDVRMSHGGCPVLIGNKWITNKWPRAHNQMFDRSCPTHTKQEIRHFRRRNQKAAFFDGI